MKKSANNSKLKIKVGSFSYKKGIPKDSSGNGGGFVFDCRGILNPGRIDQYKTQTGRDQEVIDYLENKTRMPEFIQNIFSVIDITVEDYINRGFESLHIMFGCTGGQHRSVYSADATAKHLKEKYGIVTEPFHREQEAKNWINKMY
ncbi:MAG: ATP-binding protein [Flavobacteriales bacterium]